MCSCGRAGQIQTLSKPRHRGFARSALHADCRAADRFQRRRPTRPLPWPDCPAAAGWQALTAHSAQQATEPDALTQTPTQTPTQPESRSKSQSRPEPEPGSGTRSRHAHANDLSALSQSRAAHLSPLNVPVLFYLTGERARESSRRFQQHRLQKNVTRGISTTGCRT